MNKKTIKDLLELEKEDVVGLKLCGNFIIILEKDTENKIICNISNGKKVNLGKFDKTMSIEGLMIETMTYLIENNSKIKI